MEDLEYKLTIFEVVPFEQLGFSNPANDVQSIVLALQQVGLELVKNSNYKKVFWFIIRDKERFQLLTRAVLTPNEDELFWLLTEFFEYLLLIPTHYDLLFALTSTKDPGTEGGPYARDAHYISSEIGNPFYPPSLARILCAGALKQIGLREFGERIDCISNFPNETALAGDILFVHPPIDFSAIIRDGDTGFEWRPLSLLSSKLLLSQKIIDILQEEAVIDQIELAKVLPFQIMGRFDQTFPFHTQNHFAIRAKFGTQIEVLEEILGVSLHLTWSKAKSYTEKLPKKAALSFGFGQLRRLKDLEEKETALRYALNILQKRYPARKDLIELEVSNLYSNVVRYSPVYLAWQAHLRAFVQGDPGIDNQFTLLVRQIDWSTLENFGVATKDEAEKVVNLLQTDPGSLLTRIRVIIEQCVLYLYQRKYLRPATTTLHNMIQRLDRDLVFPPMISIYLTALRTSGNIGAHTGADSREDVEVLLPLFVRVLEWFLYEGVSKISLPH